MQAIILAAGKGSRLKPHHDGPKALIRLGTKTILEESIQCLHKNGITHVILVMGFEAGKFDPLIAKYCLHPVLNAQYESAGSLRSLLLAESLVFEDTLILEADIVYECKAIANLLQDPSPNLTLLSGPTGHGDEMYAFGQQNRVNLLSKSQHPELNCLGEFIGITKLSIKFINYLFCECRGREATWDAYDINGLMRVGERIPLGGHLVSNLIWTEIDDLAQFKRAKELIYPRLEAARAAARQAES